MTPGVSTLTAHRAPQCYIEIDSTAVKGER